MSWTANLLRAARLEPGERVLVVVDEPLREEGRELAEAVRGGGAFPRLELWDGARPLEHPPATMLEAARESTLCYFLAREPHRLEASARVQLAETVLPKGREIFLGFVDAELLRGELSQPAPDLSELVRSLLAEVEGADSVRVRGAAGTDLELRVAGRPWLTDALPLRAGDFANYPGGEIFVAPHRDGADGVLVADLTVPYTVDGLVDEPVRLTFAAGRVTAVEGGEAAERLRRLVAEAGEGADVIGELGLGLNPTVRPRGHVMLDEKAAGTAHVAIGDNTGAFGGDNAASIHVDMTFSAPEVEVDGRPLALPDGVR